MDMLLTNGESWKESRLDVAEHMFIKTENLHQKLDASSAENMADTLRHIGADLYSKGDFLMSIKWLKRARRILNSQQLDRLSVEGLDNRLAIYQYLVWNHLATKEPEMIAEADELVASVEAEIGDKPIILHWKLEILQRLPDEMCDANTYASILERMIRIFDFTDQSYHFLMHHIKELHRSSSLAFALLDKFLAQCILQSGNIVWLEKLIVRYAWMSSMETGLSGTGMTALKEALSTVRRNYPMHLSPECIGAVHSVRSDEAWHNFGANRCS